MFSLGRDRAPSSGLGTKRRGYRRIVGKTAVLKGLGHPIQLLHPPRLRLAIDDGARTLEHLRLAIKREPLAAAGAVGCSEMTAPSLFSSVPAFAS